MNISDLHNKLVAVIGYGMEGKAVAQYLSDRGISPVVFDEKEFSALSHEDQEHIRQKGWNGVFGPDCLKELRGYDVAFRSPGISLSKPEIQKSISEGLVVTSQTKWFFEHCPARVVGVTGTKGKGTTSTLIARMLESVAQSGKGVGKVFLTGNIGAVQPLEIVDTLQESDIVVFELSSFQLQDLHVSPHIGVVLMVTQEHLDYHADVEEYRQAKESIVAFQKESDFALINEDFSASVAIGQKGAGTKYFFSRHKKLSAGCYIDGDTLVVKDVQGKSFEFSVGDVHLRGKHNLENICAATLAATIVGVPWRNIEDVAKNFKGLEHRLEFVAAKNGVSFYNDSFSTTPETAIAAIRSFSEPLIVLLGGSSKNADFTELVDTLNETVNVKSVVLIGEEGKRIHEIIERANEGGGEPHFKIIVGSDDFTKVMNEQVFAEAKPGDVVLLSPACASFGMFKNYKDRGARFKELVTKL